MTMFLAVFATVLFSETTVHTNGINIEGVLANAVALTVILTFFGGIVVWLIRRSITDSVRDAMFPTVERLNEHDRRITRLEGVEEGKRLAVSQARLTSSEPTDAEKT